MDDAARDSSHDVNTRKPRIEDVRVHETGTARAPVAEATRWERLRAQVLSRRTLSLIQYGYFLRFALLVPTTMGFLVYLCGWGAPAMFRNMLVVEEPVSLVLLCVAAFNCACL